MDSAGALQLLLRTGDSVLGNGSMHVVQSFGALSAARDSLGAARGYDNNRYPNAVRHGGGRADAERAFSSPFHLRAFPRF